MKDKAKKAASAMLAALETLAELIDEVDANWERGDLAGAVANLDADIARAAITQAREAGIKSDD